MTHSISRCVVSWARCGPLGRIGTYWSQAPGVNTFRKYYELFVLCAAVSGCQLLMSLRPLEQGVGQNGQKPKQHLVQMFFGQEGQTA